VLSDLYALGVVNCDNMLMLLGVSQKLTEHDRDIVVPLLMQGFEVLIYLLCACINRNVNFTGFGHILYASVIYVLDCCQNFFVSVTGFVRKQYYTELIHSVIASVCEQLRINHLLCFVNF